MRIAVYSGSFDPLHTGHMAIMEYLTRESDFDWVYLVVSPQNPLKDSSKARSGRARYEAALEAVRRHPGLRVRVDDIELEMEPPHYTIRTLDALSRREPQNDFTLVMGADSLDSIRKWRDFPRILSEYGVVVYPRKGFDLEAIRDRLIRESVDLPSPYVLDTEVSSYIKGGLSMEEVFGRLSHIRIIDAPLVDISSTQIREGLAEGRDMSEYLM